MTVDKTNEFHSIDLAWLGRRKLLNPGQWSTLTWSRRGQTTGSIRLEVFQSAVRLVYRHRPSGGDWQDVSEWVPLVETETPFGGRRQWFECVSCRARCRILYGGGRFRCRRCRRLRYESQYEPPFARAATRALKIRERLGDRSGIDDPFPPKPKHMRWKTYERLETEYDRLNDAWAVGIMARFRP